MALVHLWTVEIEWIWNGTIVMNQFRQSSGAELFRKRFRAQVLYEENSASRDLWGRVWHITFWAQIVLSPIYERTPPPLLYWCFRKQGISRTKCSPVSVRQNSRLKNHYSEFRAKTPLLGQLVDQSNDESMDIQRYPLSINIEIRCLSCYPLEFFEKHLAAFHSGAHTSRN